MNLYAIYDTKAGYFLPVLEASTDEHAERIIVDAIRAGNEQLALHRNDFALYALGEYDNKSGSIKPHEMPDMIASMDAIIGRYFKPAVQEQMFDDSETKTDTTNKPSDTENVPS